VKGKPGPVKKSNRKTHKNEQLAGPTSKKRVADAFIEASRPINMYFNFKINVGFLIPCIQTFEHAFPIIKNEDLCQSFHIVNQLDFVSQDEVKCLQTQQDPACLAIFWSCLAIGAFLQGNEPETVRFLRFSNTSYAKHYGSKYSVPFRAVLLRALMFKCIGDDESAKFHLANAELGISDENRGVFKALQLYILPINTIFASPERFSFTESELENFTFDSRVFYSWNLLFIKHAILEDSWVYAYDCYYNLRLAEFSIKMKTIFPIRNWYRLQGMLLVLEICHLSLLEQGINRAKELVTFLSKNADFFKILEKLKENIGMGLQLVSQIFHKIRDASFYHLTNNLWRTATKGQSTLPVLDGEWFGVDNNAATTAISKKVEQAFSMNIVGTTTTLYTNNASIGLQEALALFLDSEEIGVRQDPTFAETGMDVTKTPRLFLDEKEFSPTLSESGLQASSSLFLDGVRTNDLGFQDPMLFFSEDEVKIELEEALGHFLDRDEDEIGVDQDSRFAGTDVTKTSRLFLDEEEIRPTQGETGAQATCSLFLDEEEITN